MGHVVKDLETNKEAEIVDLGMKVQDGPVKDFDLAFIEEFLVVLPHGLFTLLGELGRYFDEYILTITVQVKIVILIEVQRGVCEGTRAWAHLHNPELLHPLVLNLIQHKIGYRITIEGLK